ncbi:glycosyltransferase family 4 protein [Methylobacterium planeticum]|uniref:Glycosyltransferase n=1 Tax=Methylobacterium planeticum TaxID=2615211 RepID=A0A6N6MYN0_9HYPH|nr:glycosyltransferase [Methylobacterium planeticum]KAB1075337.1 glycosyltransferase [Methylobacterium planeticum]
MTSPSRHLNKPRVLIANERFIARFGVDRILILLAEHLVAQGVEVSFACIRCDRAVLERISPRIAEIPLPDGIDLLSADAHVRAHLLAAWASDPVDVIVSGGWPFFEIAAHARSAGAHGVFIDAGAVPHDGMPPGALPVQRALRRLRQATLPSIDTILPISRFIQESQTEPDRGGDRGVRTVLLGSDHMALGADNGAPDDAASRILLDDLDKRISVGARPILALGRVESTGYKNSLAAFEVLRGVRRKVPEAHLLMLAGPDRLDPPPDLREHVTALPTLSDATLRAVMERCDLGVSLSLWEGFNLPIAEMQWLERPVLAYSLAAHPEVIADPWFLCGSEAEMIRKAAEILVDGFPEPIRALDRFAQFRDQFTWAVTLSQWTRAILAPWREAAPASVREASRRLILVDVSNSARDPANSGVIRVTRRLSAALTRRPDLDVLFIKWNGATGTYERLSAENQPFLSSNAGPVDWIGMTADAFGDPVSLEQVMRAADPLSASKPILLLPEVILDGSAAERVQWGRARGCRAAFLLYDMLPMYETGYVDAAVTRAFPPYLAALRESDAIYAISGFSLSECERWHRDRGETLPERREVIWLPAQFSDHPRVLQPAATSEQVNILCVSTIEPRKNHRVLIKAFQALRRRRPDLPVNLHLVGNLYVGAEKLALWVRLAAEADDRIVWHGILSDAAIAEQYARTTFTVYPSLVEGFGLPIMESLWMGRPCLCHEGGVMAELAADGGCLPVNMTSVAEVSAALEQMAVNGALREVLNRQVFTRRIDTWQTYGNAISARLKEL